MKVGVIGMGLMGGSLALTLRQKIVGTQIATLRRGDERDIQEAEAKGAVDHVFATLKELLLFSEWVILSPPLTEIIPLSKRICQEACTLSKRLLVIDIGSVKEAITEAFCALSSGNVELIATHPMAGSEKSSFVHATSSLFEGAPWIVTAHEKNTPEALSSVKEWIARLGARPVDMKAQEHDRQVALISHLPALLSHLLWEFVVAQDPKSLQIAGPGFASMTRLAKEPPARFLAMKEENRENLSFYWNLWIDFLQRKGM